MNSSIMSIPFKTRLTMQREQKERHLGIIEEQVFDRSTINKVFFLKKDEPIFLADMKYIYECIDIQIKIDGTKDYRLFCFDTQTNRAEYFDITATVENFDFGTLRTNPRPHARH